MHKYAKIAIIGAVALLPIYCMAADDKSKTKSQPVAAKPAPNAPTAQKPGNPWPRGWGRLDTNRDGTVSKDEFLAPPTRRFTDIDANKDGKITADEMRAFNDKRRQQAQERGARRQGGHPPQAQQPAPAQPKQ